MIFFSNVPLVKILCYILSKHVCHGGIIHLYSTYSWEYALSQGFHCLLHPNYFPIFSSRIWRTVRRHHTNMLSLQANLVKNERIFFCNNFVTWLKSPSSKRPKWPQTKWFKGTSIFWPSFYGLSCGVIHSVSRTLRTCW